jgi:hypothetical protein
MSRHKSALSREELTRVEHLASQMRGNAHPRSKARWENEIAQILDGKELTRSDYATVAYYVGNSSDSSSESQQIGQAFADAYRSTPPAQ